MKMRARKAWLILMVKVKIQIRNRIKIHSFLTFVAKRHVAWASVISCGETIRYFSAKIRIPAEVFAQIGIRIGAYVSEQNIDQMLMHIIQSLLLLYLREPFTMK